MHFLLEDKRSCKHEYGNLFQLSTLSNVSASSLTDTKPGRWINWNRPLYWHVATFSMWIPNKTSDIKLQKTQWPQLFIKEASNYFKWPKLLSVMLLFPVLFKFARGFSFQNSQLLWFIHLLRHVFIKDLNSFNILYFWLYWGSK